MTIQSIYLKKSIMLAVINLNNSLTISPLRAPLEVHSPMIKKPSPIARFLALWLTFSLTLPSPAFGLREIQTKNSGVEEQELSEALLNRPTTAGAEEEVYRTDWVRQFYMYEATEPDPLNLEGKAGRLGLIRHDDGSHYVLRLEDDLDMSVLPLEASKISGPEVIIPSPESDEWINAIPAVDGVVSDDRLENRNILLTRTDNGLTLSRYHRGNPGYTFIWLDAAGVEESWILIGPTVAAEFAGLEQVAGRQGSHLLVDDASDGAILGLIDRGHRAGVAVTYFGGLEEARRFKVRAAGALIPVTIRVRGQPDFMAELESVLLAAGLPREVVSAGLEALAASAGELDVAA